MFGSLSKHPADSHATAAQRAKARPLRFRDQRHSLVPLVTVVVTKL